jgi:hypothetical protein
MTPREEINQIMEVIRITSGPITAETMFWDSALVEREKEKKKKSRTRTVFSKARALVRGAAKKIVQKGKEIVGRKKTAKEAPKEAPKEKKAAPKEAPKEKTPSVPRARKGEPTKGKGKEEKPDKGDSGRWGKRNNPFKRKDTLGPTRAHEMEPPEGPPPKGTSVNRKTKKWACKSDPDNDHEKTGVVAQVCTGIAKSNRGEKRQVSRTKKARNHAQAKWKKWRTHQRARETAAGKRGFYWGSK